MAGKVTSSHRVEYLNKPGNMNNFCRDLAIETNMSISDIVKKLPLVLPKLSEKQEIAIRQYYMRQNSIANIKESGRFKSYVDVEGCLESAQKKIIKLIIGV